MTRRDYDALAKIIRKRAMVRRKPTVTAIAIEIADYCEQDNPGFDRDRFFIACGLKRRHIMGVEREITSTCDPIFNP